MERTCLCQHRVDFVKIAPECLWIFAVWQIHTDSAVRLPSGEQDHEQAVGSREPDEAGERGQEIRG